MDSHQQNLNAQSSNARKNAKPEYVTLSVMRREFGRSNYVAVSRKSLVISERTLGTFVLIERGFVRADRTDKCHRFTTVPDTPEVLEWLVTQLTALRMSATARAEAAPAEA